MDNFFDSIKAILYERVNNPLVSGFAISWSIINYKFFLIVFFGESLTHRLNEISILFESKNNLLGVEAIWLNGIALPFVFTILYIFVLPFISTPVISFYYKSITKMKNKKLENEGHEILSEEKSRALRIKIREVESKNKKLLEEAAADIEDHILTIRQLNEKITEQEKTISQYKEEKIIQEHDSYSTRTQKESEKSGTDKSDTINKVYMNKPRNLPRKSFDGRLADEKSSESSITAAELLDNTILMKLAPDNKDRSTLRKILYELNKNKNDGMSLSDVSSKISMPAIEVDYYIKLLEKHDLAFSNLVARGGNSAKTIKITDEGSQLILDIIDSKK